MTSTPPANVCRHGFLLLCLLATHVTGYPQSQNFRSMSPKERELYFAGIRAASATERKRMMTQLRLRMPPALPADSLDPKRPPQTFRRPGSANWVDASGNIYVRSDWGTWTNYDENKANRYRLIDPLYMKNGQRVSNASAWYAKRRPEILNDYQTYIYGRIPKLTPNVAFETRLTDSGAMGGKAVMRLLKGVIAGAALTEDTPRIDLVIYMPRGVTTPVPLIVRVTGSVETTPQASGTQGASFAEQVLSRGWAYAVVGTSSLQADNGAGLSKGIIGLINRAKPRRPDDWGVLAAWTWGLSRALDFFEADPAINRREIAIQGHSRWGKTALLAAALDQRWSMVFASCSGAMGASLEKRHYGETVDNVAGTGEYHWMAGNFLKYANNWQAMPVDAHLLLSLIAPRPLFITGGTRDAWADANGMFLACAGADPVYRLLGRKGLGAKELPAPDVALVSGELAFRNHEGGHTDALDFPIFLDFAGKYFGRTSPPAVGTQ